MERAPGVRSRTVAARTAMGGSRAGRLPRRGKCVGLFVDDVLRPLMAVGSVTCHRPLIVPAAVPAAATSNASHEVARCRRPARVAFTMDVYMMLGVALVFGLLPSVVAGLFMVCCWLETQVPRTLLR